MKKFTLFLILFFNGVLAVSAQSPESIKDFTFGENMIISKRHVCYIKNNEPVMQNDWRIWKEKGYIGGSKEFIMIAYDDLTDIIALTGDTSYNAEKNCKYFSYKYRNITGKAFLIIEDGFYVLTFLAERKSDGTEKFYMYYFK